MKSLGRTTLAGFLWLFSQTIGTRLVNVAGQIVLAWLLVKEDFGLISLALTVSTFAVIFQRLGLHLILINRQKRFHLWVTPAFWMSFLSGLAAAMLIVLAAPVAATLYHAPTLAILIPPLAVIPILESLCLVCRARLQIDLRFRALAFLNLANIAVNMTVCTLAAWYGWGAFSFVFGQIAGSILSVVLFWLIAPVRFEIRFQFNRWKYLLSDAGNILANGLIITLLFQGDYILLGLFHTEAAVGIYYFAYRLSTQTIQILALNLSGVLFPVLTKLQGDLVRQRTALINAASVLLLVGVPVCLAQAAVAKPIIHLIFDPKWNDAVLVLQILSIGMIGRILQPVSASLIRAQGRFATLLKISSFSTALFLMLVTVAVSQGEVISVSIAVTVAFFIIGPFYLIAAIRPTGGSPIEVFRIFIRPLVLGIVCFGPTMLLVDLLPDSPLGQLLQIVTVIGVGGSLYTLLARVCMPEACAQLALRIKGFRRLSI